MFKVSEAGLQACGQRSVKMTALLGNTTDSCILGKAQTKPQPNRPLSKIAHKRTCEVAHLLTGPAHHSQFWRTPAAQVQATQVSRTESPCCTKDHASCQKSSSGPGQRLPSGSEVKLATGNPGRKAQKTKEETDQMAKQPSNKDKVRYQHLDL